MRFVSLVNGLVGKARRGISQGLSISHGDDPKASTEKLAEQLRQVMLRLNKIEATATPEATEFEVTVSTAGAIVELNHNYGSAVRWWVTSWLQTSGVAYPVTSPALAEDSTSTADILRLRSYAAGRAVIRVEPSQAYLDPGVIVVGTVPATSGTPSGTGFYHTVLGVMDAAAVTINLAAASGHVTGTLPVANGGTGLVSFGSGVATWIGTPSGANLASALTSALPATKGGTGLTSLGSGVATWLGTPSGANLASALSSALPDTKGGTGLTALGTGVATWLGTPSGANLAAALTTSLPLSKSTAWVTRGVFSSRPSAGTAGRLYMCTDGPLSFYDDGTNWQPFLANNSLTSTPAVSGLTQILAGGRSINLTDSKGGIFMEMTNANSSDDYRVAKLSRATGAFTFTVHMIPMLTGAIDSGAGICWRESAGGSCQFFGVVMGTAGVPYVIVRNETTNNNTASPTFTFSSDVITAIPCGELTFSNGVFLRLADDGTTNKTFQYSLDNNKFVTLATLARTSFFTPNEYGIWVANIAAGTTNNGSAFFSSWTP